jgi:hypothetical protein
MLSKKLSVIHERDNLEQISQISPTSLKQIKEFRYSLKQNVFDPTKSSPPNDFMMKLKLRMSIYDNNVDNFDSE